jgi:STE24 endopeptidase
LRARAAVPLAFLLVFTASCLAGDVTLPADAADATHAQLQALAEKYFTPEQIATGRRHVFGYRIFYLIGLILKGSLLVFLCSRGAGRRMLAWCERRFTRRPRASQALYLLAVWLILAAGMLPLRLIALVYGRAWGETYSYGQFLIDWLIGWTVSAVVLVPALALIVCLRARTRAWPLLVWAAGCMLAAVLTFAQPYVYDPLFNDFWPVTEKPVRERAEKLARAAGLEVHEILWTDASRRTRHGNAYFVGWGASRRIVLYNTVAQYDLDTLESLLAHEIGHWRHDHVVKGLLWGCLGGLAFVLLLPAGLKGLGRLPIIGHAREGSHVLDAPHLLLAAWLVLVVSTPLASAISRAFEVRADRESLERTGEPAAFIRLEVRLSLQNQGDVLAPRFLEWWYHTHPTTARRIAAAEIFAREQGIALPPPDELLRRRPPAVPPGGRFPPPVDFPPRKQEPAH